MASGKDQAATAEFDLTTPDGVLAYLASTPFASTRAEPLSGGTANFIFRLRLRTPHEGRPTLILKHARPYAALSPDFAFPVSRQDFEVEALRHVRAALPPDARVTVPAVHLHDTAAHAIIMDDAGAHAAPLKAALLAGAVSPARGAALGTALGAFLRALHGAAALRGACADNDVGRTVSVYATYGRLGATLRDGGALPALGGAPLGVRDAALQAGDALAARRSEQIHAAQGGLVMGDFWPGNVLVPQEEGEAALVVDWELAKPGVPGLDVGQFCAELATLRRLRPEGAEAAGAVLESFVRAYFRGDDGAEAEEARRVALGHFGVHLVIWTPRAGWDAGVEATRALVLEGVEHLVEGTKERAWTDDELLAKFMH